MSATSIAQTTAPTPTVVAVLENTSTNNNTSNNIASSSLSLAPTSAPEPKNSLKKKQSSQSETTDKTTTTATTILHHQQPKPPKPLWPSILAGATQAILFNPIDRALYLRVHNREKHLFVWNNWSHPFQGFANAAVYRTISGATYLFFQDSFKYAFQTMKPEYFDANYYKNTSEINSRKMTNYEKAVEKRNLYLLQLTVGTCAGAANGMSLNWFQLIKFRLWSEGANAGFFSTAKHLYEVGGVKMFFRGAGVSVMRDVSFGIAYEVLRAPGLEIAAEMKQKQQKDLLLNNNNKNKNDVPYFDESELYQFGYNASAGALASMVSSPFNYCRNLMYGSSTCSSPLRVSSMLEFLFREITAHATPMSHMNARLNLGWGTVRVGVGIACGQAVYSWVNKMMD